MDELNKWRHLHPDPEDELAYMYRQQEEDHAGMQQQHHHFAERLPEQQQYYTPPPPVAPPTSSSPFLPRLHHTSNFPGFGDPAVPPRLPFRPAKNEPGQPSSSSNRILSFGGQPPSTLNFSGGDWTEAGVEAVQQMPPDRRSRTHWNTQEHVIAERKRREKMQQQFVTLATIVPDLTKVMHISCLVVL
ncbi:Transcription factor bHLH18 [Zea mays]|uniref:Transcription factor bHLH18 n=1 Tax=Zea mays TaxID=4577 RepID=A0A1D6JUB2_MAIZE|nr:Transcription factor bHLH18 [Zea mays]